MIEGPGFLLSVLAFLLALGPLVFVHELGHYLAGRRFGVKVEAFSVGFGREIGGFTDRHGTRWKFGWLPLGGYVRFAGDMNPASQPSAEWLSLPAAERSGTFQAKPLWQRAIIVAAGPVINFLIAILILAGFALAYGESRTPPTIGLVGPNSAAAAAGLRPGDRILSMGGRSVDTFDDVARYTRIRPGEASTIQLVREGQVQTVAVTLGTTTERDRFGNVFRLGKLGIGPAGRVIEPVGVLEAPVVAVRQTGQMVGMMVDTLWQIVSGRRPVSELGGPISIARASGEQLVLGPQAFVFLVALISINLGFINLLPVPMLDGGHLLFYAIEAVRRRPTDPRVVEWAFRGGVMAILALMVLVTANDLGSLGLWRGLSGLIG
ncbi:M50 family metallopeptidase [Sphingomonas sp. MJ1 (PH-R8)]|uniref:M50 family metallopeptidase n=1 Tax=Sphingomonas sp. MJ1 (PH-R8) TaxID=3112950 RepID=UPI003A87137F